jgi:hypothetical protein
MQEQYTDHDTERVRQAEASSAGRDTQRLAGLPSNNGPVVPQTRARGAANSLAALALIIGGILWLLGLLSPFGWFQLETEPGMILLTIASCLLFFAFWKRIYGLLIPGSILAGLSLGITFVNVTDGVSVLWGLALGFLGILFVGRAYFNLQSSWPVYPAVPLFAVGVIVAVANLPGFLAGGLIWLPLLLIGAGLVLGWRNR